MPKIVKSVKLSIQYYSILFIRVLTPYGFRLAAFLDSHLDLGRSIEERSLQSNFFFFLMVSYCLNELSKLNCGSGRDRHAKVQHGRVPLLHRCAEPRPRPEFGSNGREGPRRHDRWSHATPPNFC